MLVTASHQSGQDVFVSFDKEELKLIPKVADHPLFSDEINWETVSIVFKHALSAKRLVSGFKNDFVKTDNVKVKPDMQDGEVYQLHEIIISGDGRVPMLSIKREDIPDASTMDFALGGDNYISVKLTTNSPPWRTYFPSGADTYFYVEATFSTSVSGFDASKLNIVNGTVDSIEYIEWALTYVVKINPIGAGMLEVYIPSESAQASDGRYNSESNKISVEFIEAVTVTAYSPDTDELGRVFGQFDVIMNFSEPVFLPDSVEGLGQSIQIQGNHQLNATISNFQIVSAINWVEGVSPYATTFKFTVTAELPGPITIFLNNNAATTEKNVTTENTSLYIADYWPYSTVTLTTPEQLVNGDFVVTANFSQDIFGFGVEDILITNGVVSNLWAPDQDENGNPIGEMFTFTVTPTNEGPVTIYVPYNVTVGANGAPNAPSNELVVDYQILGYRYYKFGFRDSWIDNNSNNGYRYNRIGLSDIKMTWDGAIKNMTGATLSYLVNPTGGSGNLIDGVVYSGPITLANSYMRYWDVDKTKYTDLFKIDLKEKRDVTSIHFAPIFGQNLPRTFKIHASNDDVNWTEVFSIDEIANTWSYYQSYKEFVIKPKKDEYVMIGNGTPKISGASYRYVKMAIKESWLSKYTTTLSTWARISQINFVWDGKIHNLKDLGVTETILCPTISVTYPSPWNPPDDIIGSTGSNTFFWTGTLTNYKDLFTVDLLSSRNIEYILIANSLNDVPKNFKIYGSNDNTNWSEIISINEDTYLWANDGYRIFGGNDVPSQRLKWSSSLNWDPESVPNSLAACANVFGQVGLGKSYNANKSIDLDIDVTLNKLEINGPTNSWAVKDGGYSKSIALGGENPTINFNSLGADHSIEVPIVVNGTGEFRIGGNFSGSCSVSGQVTSIGKNIKSNTTNQFSSVFLSNENNNISGTIDIDSASFGIKSVDSENCVINWSNKTGNNVGTSVLSTSNWDGQINFIGDGVKKYLIANSAKVTYNGILSGTITNNLQLKNCVLNQSSHNLSFSSNSNIIVNSGELEWKNISALPSNVILQVFNKKGIPSVATDTNDFCTIKFPANSVVLNDIKMDGTAFTSFDSLKSSIFVLDNTNLSGNIYFSSKGLWEESPHYVAGITFIGNGTHSGNTIGQGYSLAIIIGNVSNQNNIINLTGNHNVQYGGALRIEYGVLNLTGTTRASTNVYASGSLYGTGSIIQNWGNHNYMLLNEGILCPEDYNNPSVSNYFTVKGKFSNYSTGKVKFRFDSLGNCTKLVVDGNLILAGSIGIKAGTIQSGQIYTVIQYTGTRTGTFSTNNLGAGTSLVYDDANKRVLVTKA